MLKRAEPSTESSDGVKGELSTKQTQGKLNSCAAIWGWWEQSQLAHQEPRRRMSSWPRMRPLKQRRLRPSAQLLLVPTTLRLTDPNASLPRKKYADGCPSPLPPARPPSNGLRDIFAAHHAWCTSTGGRLSTMLMSIQTLIGRDAHGLESPRQVGASCWDAT